MFGLIALKRGTLLVMVKKLFLLDGMALVYRAHFAFVSRPILTSKGVNTSALYGFTQTLLDILKNQQPTHIAVAFDTPAPTHRHIEFPDYKANREEMPEELSAALPHVRRMAEALKVPVLICDGYEADDIIGTLVQRAGKEGFQSYMVTSDKDFGQLITANTFIYKPSRSGEGVEIIGLPEIQSPWGVQRPEQVVDVLALMGDASDNIPGVPGIGEKTAMKLIGQYDAVENLLSRAGELTGRVKQTLETNREQALLSKRLATIICDAPCAVDLDALKVQPPDEQKLKDLLMEFEFNSIGRRLFGEDFKAGRGSGSLKSNVQSLKSTPAAPGDKEAEQLVLVSETQGGAVEAKTEPAAANLKTIADMPHEYHLVASPAERAKLIQSLRKLKCFCFDTETTNLDPKQARLVGLAFSFAPHTGYYVPVPPDAVEAKAVLEEFRTVLESEGIEKVGHNLKFDLSVLKWQGVSVGGKLFDTMVAHSLIEPEMRHGMCYLSEVYLGYTPVPISKLIGYAKSGQLNMADVPVAKVAEYSAEDADVTWQLRT